MGLFLTCLAILLTFLSPVELVPSLAPYRPTLIVQIFAVVFSVPTIAMRPTRQLQYPQAVLVVGLWGAIVISHLSHAWIRSAANSITAFGPSAAIFFLILINAFTVKRIRLIGATVIFCGIVTVIQGMLAYYTGWNAAQLLLYPPDDYRSIVGNRIRGYGILGDPNDLAQFCLIGIAFLGLFWKRNAALRNTLLFIPAGVLLFGTYLTFSRGAMLGVCAMMFALMYRKVGSVVSVAGAAVVFLAMRVFQFNGARDITVDNGRMVAWGAGIGGLLSRPIFGIGYGHFLDINDLTAHNSFVLCFAELGFFGYFFWLALILTTLMGLWALAKLPRTAPEDDEYAGVVRAVLVSVAGFLVTAWFLSRTYHETTYVVIAIAAATIQLRSKALPSAATQFRKWAPRTMVAEVVSVIVIYISIRARAFI